MYYAQIAKVRAKCVTFSGLSRAYVLGVDHRWRGLSFVWNAEGSGDFTWERCPPIRHWSKAGSHGSFSSCHDCVLSPQIHVIDKAEPLICLHTFSGFTLASPHQPLV